MLSHGFLPRIRLLVILSVITYMNGSVGSWALSVKTDGPSFKKEGRLEFIQQNTRHILNKIDIEIADNSEDRAQGLMWRHSMFENQGMLFVYEKERLLSYWMKNTYIPLDVIFINNSREIVSIYPNTIPLNKTSIFNDKPAQYVIEVIAGFCGKFGIKVGDKIKF